MDLISIVQLLFIYVVAITIHEYSHAAMSHRLGDPTAAAEGRLTLNPLAHIDPFVTLALPLMLILIGSPIIFGAAKPVPFNPFMVRGGDKGAALVALAGPASNLILAVVTAIFLRLVPGLVTAGQGLLVKLLLINIALALFNLIPIPPLDGSRILYAFMPDPVRRAMEKFESMGFVAILIIFIVVYPVIVPFLRGAISALSSWLLGV
ncbi:site-2 protease family protein [Candidatus Saccharibacteria bacterium]|nr:site-2 protease family protein [Candidatus Saccharibacteria bacterium]